MKVKVSEASGRVLDWMVAVAANVEIDEDNEPIWFDEADGAPVNEYRPVRFTPSTNWSQGGPIAERERIDRTCINGTEYMWMATVYVGGSKVQAYGGTSLEAAMRAFVIGKLGYEVDVPEELLT